MNRIDPNSWLRPSASLDRIFQDLWLAGAPLAGAGATSEPALNVHETAEGFEVELDLPGIALEDLEVTLEGRELTVRGHRKTALPEGASWQRRERFHGDFTRQLRFGVDLDPARIEASLLRGVLTIRLAKAEQAKARRIPVSGKSADTESN